MRTKLLFAVTLVAALGLASWFAPSRGQPTPAVAPKPAPPVGQLVGSDSCAGRSCHGSLQPLEHSKLSWQCEFTRWVRADPHADAFNMLANERSKEIAKRLGIEDAQGSLVCRACHTNPVAAIGPAHRERAFGVGCESCHGNASGWLTAHLRKDWSKQTAAEKAKAGMIDVREPAELAKQCAGCHVGSALGDVNHDLIAAGHPRLAFEFGAFLANLPPHWNAQPRDEGRTWALGQLASADAALALLEQRAKNGPWPEFAEYDCFGCHHGLREKQKPGNPRRTLAWGSWYFAVPKALGDETPQLDALAKTMNRLRPDREAVQAQIGPARKEIAGLKTKLPVDRKRLAGSQSFDKRPRWDGAEQLFLGLVALSQDDAAERGRLDALAGLRAFPRDGNGPSSEPKTGFNVELFLTKLRAR